MAGTVGARCRLYLDLSRPPAAMFAGRGWHALLTAGDVASVLLPASGDGVFGEEALQEAIRAVQERGIAALLRDEPQAAMALGADGIHLPGAADMEARLRAARGILGAERIIGAHAGVSRHQAMVLGEWGADYIAFGPGNDGHGQNGDARRDLVAWWAEMFEVPCVAWDVESPAAAQRLAACGADFVALGEVVWRRAEDGALAVAAFDAALKAAGEADGANPETDDA